MALIRTTVETTPDGSERVLNRKRIHRTDEAPPAVVALVRRCFVLADHDWSRWSVAPDPRDLRYAEAARRTGEILARVIARSR
jgi:hypothetical protein